MIQVWTAEDLDNVRNNLDGNYIQMADIDLLGYANWDPIGDTTVPFTGSYNGNNYRIENLTIDTNTRGGLFGDVDGEQTFQNIRLINIDVKNYSGGLIGQSLSQGPVQKLTIHRCLVTGVLRGGSGVGAIAGRLDAWASDRTTISQCAAIVDVEGDESLVGGFVGGARYCDFTDCYVRGRIHSSDPSGWGDGGFVGQSNWSTYTNCYVAAEVSGDVYAGAFVGHSQGDSFENCYYDSDLSAVADSHATGRETDPMTHPENFDTTYIDWDFEGVWTSDVAGDVNEYYPYFLWMKDIKFAITTIAHSTIHSTNPYIPIIVIYMHNLTAADHLHFGLKSAMEEIYTNDPENPDDIERFGYSMDSGGTIVKFPKDGIPAVNAYNTVVYAKIEVAPRLRASLTPYCQVIEGVGKDEWWNLEFDKETPDWVYLGLEEDEEPEYLFEHEVEGWPPEEE